MRPAHSLTHSFSWVIKQAQGSHYAAAFVDSVFPACVFLAERSCSDHGDASEARMVPCILDP